MHTADTALIYDLVAALVLCGRLPHPSTDGLRVVRGFKVFLSTVHVAAMQVEQVAAGGRHTPVHFFAAAAN